MILTIAMAGHNGTGNDILYSTKQVLLAVGKKFEHTINFFDVPLGDEAIKALGEPFPQKSIEICKCSDAILVGALNDKSFNNKNFCYDTAINKLKKELGLYSQFCFIKKENIIQEKEKTSDNKTSNYQSVLNINHKDINYVIVREINGGCFYSERGFRSGEFGREAFDTECYSEIEIERVARTAFELAQERKHKLCSVDKANVLLSSKLWRKIVHDIHEDYPDVELKDMSIEESVIELSRNPGQFDVILTSNLFGSILTSLSEGVSNDNDLFSFASIGATNIGVYETLQPTTYDNYIGYQLSGILSSAYALRYSFNLNREASAIEKAVERLCFEKIENDQTLNQITKTIINYI